MEIDFSWPKVWVEIKRQGREEKLGQKIIQRKA
jgi:hypothetical protein